MPEFTKARKLRLLASGALALSAALFTGLAHAQYAWVDANGVRQFSDRPPPPSTPLKDIRKAPGLQARLDAEAAVAIPVPAAADGADKAKAPPTLAERELAYRKRTREAAERDQKAAGEARDKAAQAENCHAARVHRQQLDSGIRMRGSDKNGEPGFMSDDERAASGARADKILAQCR